MMTPRRTRRGAQGLLAAAGAYALIWLAISPGAASPQAAPEIASAIGSITEASVRAHLAVLAHDQLRGRDTPSEGLETAATYIAELHTSYGLEPAGPGGSFMQRYPLGLMGPDPASASIRLHGPGGTTEPRVGRDAFFDGGSEERVEGPLTFANMELAGAAEPGSLAGAIAVFELPGGWDPSLWSTSLRQAAYARAAGALAIVHILDSGFPSSVVGQLGSALAQPRWRLGGDAFLPRIFVRRRAFEDVIPEGERPWNEASENAAGPGSLAPVPGTRLEAELPLNIVSIGDPPNVVAELPGRDPVLRDEYIVLTAHFDHVGVGQAVDGDSIYNGADDNGSGTTVLLEVSRVLGSLPRELRPRRSVLFLHVSGEEKGLLGSEWWVDHPTRPIGNAVANINMDMVGGNTHPDTIAVLGREYSSLGPLLMKVNGERPELGLTTVPDMWPQEALFFRSDQFNFMREEIPSLFLFAGFHECYHRPCDELDFVSFRKISRVARLTAHTVLEIGNRDERPEWTPDGLTEVRRTTGRGAARP